ncbi:hypothetical protein EYB31_22140 [Paenibacillus thalictri]|uniref:Uncharacterized protein n=2 Tax=Paenibacillus thalictri TaxID=2527873 RepID=A0A4Q9DL83_9BACL|nr:hypothetical protein EYB31_22140 [Paenibacillus thalictri]
MNSEEDRKEILMGILRKLDYMHANYDGKDPDVEARMREYEEHLDSVIQELPEKNPIRDVWKCYAESHGKLKEILGFTKTDQGDK